MLYIPIVDLYFKHERHVHDFLIQGVFYVATYLVDAQAIYGFGYNNVFFSLVVFIVWFFLARSTIKAFGKEKLFGNFVNWSWKYCLFMATFSWVVYLLMIRWRMIS